jgi:hypothetical protein
MFFGGSFERIESGLHPKKRLKVKHFFGVLTEK